jgi:hypothetical protein
LEYFCLIGHHQISFARVVRILSDVGIKFGKLKRERRVKSAMAGADGIILSLESETNSASAKFGILWCQRIASRRFGTAAAGWASWCTARDRGEGCAPVESAHQSLFSGSPTPHLLLPAWHTLSSPFYIFNVDGGDSLMRKQLGFRHGLRGWCSVIYLHGAMCGAAEELSVPLAAQGVGRQWGCENRIRRQ